MFSGLFQRHNLILRDIGKVSDGLPGTSPILPVVPKQPVEKPPAAASATIAPPDVPQLAREILDKSLILGTEGIFNKKDKALLERLKSSPDNVSEADLQKVTKLSQKLEKAIGGGALTHRFTIAGHGIMERNSPTLMATRQRLEVLQAACQDPNQRAKIKAQIDDIDARLVRKGDVKALEKFAGNDPARQQALLSACQSNPELAAMVAASPHASPRMLTQLAGDPHIDASVQTQVMRNPKTPGEALAKMIIGSQPANSSYVFNLTLKSNEELHNMVKNIFPDRGEDAIRATVEAIKTSLPNRASSSTVSLIDKEGHKFNAPETVAFEGKTYGSPSFLGSGAFGRTLKYTNPNAPNDTVIVKQLKDTTNQGARQEMVKELLAHRQVMGPDGKGHDNVAGLKGALTGPNDGLYQVMEEADGTNLFNVINTLNHVYKATDPQHPQAKNESLMSYSDRALVGQYLARQLVDGLAYINEEQGMLHLDIKPDNIMYDSSSGKAKIIDFGRTVAVHEAGTVATGYTGYADVPALVARVDRGEENSFKDTFNEHSDKFSAGQTIHELMTGHRVFKTSGLTEKELLKEQGEIINWTRKGEAALKVDVVKSGNTEQVDDFTAFGQAINKTFASDPSQREKLSTLSANPMFTDPLGSDERAKTLLNKVVELSKAGNGLSEEVIKGQLALMGGSLETYFNKRDYLESVNEKLKADPTSKGLKQEQEQLMAEVTKLQSDMGLPHCDRELTARLKQEVNTLEQRFDTNQPLTNEELLKLAKGSRNEKILAHLATREGQIAEVAKANTHFNVEIGSSYQQSMYPTQQQPPYPPGITGYYSSTLGYGWPS